MEFLFSIAATILGAVAVMILRHVSKKMDRQNNRQRLMNYKIDTLAECTSEQFGNGSFQKKYDAKLISKMKEDDFVYKEI